MLTHIKNFTGELHENIARSYKAITISRHFVPFPNTFFEVDKYF